MRGLAAGSASATRRSHGKARTHALAALPVRPARYPVALKLGRQSKSNWKLGHSGSKQASTSPAQRNASRPDSDDQHPLQMPLILRSRATSAGSRFISTGILTSGLFAAGGAVVFSARWCVRAVAGWNVQREITTIVESIPIRDRMSGCFPCAVKKETRWPRSARSVYVPMARYATLSSRVTGRISGVAVQTARQACQAHLRIRLELKSR